MKSKAVVLVGLVYAVGFASLVGVLAVGSAVNSFNSVKDLPVQETVRAYIGTANDNFRGWVSDGDTNQLTLGIKELQGLQQYVSQNPGKRTGLEGLEYKIQEGLTKGEATKSAVLQGSQEAISGMDRANPLQSYNDVTAFRLNGWAGAAISAGFAAFFTGNGLLVLGLIYDKVRREFTRNAYST